MWRIGRKLGSLARIGRKAFGSIVKHGGSAAKIGKKVLHQANKVPILQQKLAPLNKAVAKAEKAYGTAMRVKNTVDNAREAAKLLPQAANSLLKGDVSAAIDAGRGLHNAATQSVALVKEAKNTLEKAKRQKGQGVAFV